MIGAVHYRTELRVLRAETYVLCPELLQTQADIEMD